MRTGIDWDWDGDRDWDWDSDRDEGEDMDKDCDWERDEGRTEDERRGAILRQRTRGTKGVEERKKLAGEEVVPGVQVSASFLSRFFSFFFSSLCTHLALSFPRARVVEKSEIHGTHSSSSIFVSH